MIDQTGGEYLIEYTGTPPEKQEFILHGSKSTGIVVKINYSNAGAYAIYDDDNNLQ